MAAIIQVDATGLPTVPVTLTRTPLTAGTDTLTYVQGTKQQLVLWNTTAAPVTVTLVGSAATTVTPPGYGGTISVAAGKAILVPLSATVIVDLDDIYAYLQGNVTLTGGLGLTAHLYT